MNDNHNDWVEQVEPDETTMWVSISMSVASLVLYLALLACAAPWWLAPLPPLALYLLACWYTLTRMGAP